MDDTRTLFVEPGERVLLSPESRRFADNYRKINPQTAREVRALIGLTDDMGKTLADQGARSGHASDFSRAVSIDELDSKDSAARDSALAYTGQALYSYALDASPERLRHMEPAIERFLELSPIAVNVVALYDIVVADGSTLVISEDTHVLDANKIIMQGSGKIEIYGHTRFNVNSILGS